MITVLVSSGAEWRALKKLCSVAECGETPYGEVFDKKLSCGDVDRSVVFMRGGVCKTRAAGAAQYAISTYRPELLINIGTCGGFRGHVESGDIILVERTIIYDVYERMCDPDLVIERLSTTMSLAWITEDVPFPVRRGLMLTADRDLDPADIRHLREKYDGIAVDWESGAIAYVASANNTPCLILRGVSDLADEESSGTYEEYASRTPGIMSVLLDSLPEWIRMFVCRRRG